MESYDSLEITGLKKQIKGFRSLVEMLCHGAFSGLSSDQLTSPEKLNFDIDRAETLANKIQNNINLYNLKPKETKS